MTIYGYIRISTREQNEDRQLIALQAAGVPSGNIFLDKQSGKDFYRPQYRILARNSNWNGVLSRQTFCRWESLIINGRKFRM